MRVEGVDAGGCGWRGWMRVEGVEGWRSGGQAKIAQSAAGEVRSVYGIFWNISPTLMWQPSP